MRALNSDDHFVAARLARQRRLVDESPLRLQAVVYEAALRNLVGSPDVMRGQLEQLTTSGQQPNISVRVLPFSAGAQLGMGCGFSLRKSSYSDHEDVCVEVADNIPGTIAVRDSQDPAGPILQLDPASWTAFQSAVAGGWFKPQRPRR